MAEQEQKTRTLILLMKDMEAEFFEGFLARMAPSLTVHRAQDITTLHNVVDLVEAKSISARLIAFSTNIIVPAQILETLNGNCLNFHPGPPEYPGYRPTGFALYAGETRYGVTGHYMTARVDAGPIIGVDRYPLTENADIIETAKEAYQRLARLALSLLPAIIQINTPIQTIAETWGAKKTTRAEYEAMQRLPKDASDDEIQKRLRCFDGVYCPLDAPPSKRYAPLNDTSRTRPHKPGCKDHAEDQAKDQAKD